MREKIEFREFSDNCDQIISIFHPSNTSRIRTKKCAKITDLFYFSCIKSLLKEVFLPQGYPESVHPDYIPYQIWDTVQAFASTILGTLTTHSILQGVGVGESTATPLAASISWILKDGTGMIGRILFAWWRGSDLDAQSKKWRLVADVLNDIAMGIELTLPHFSQSSVTMLLCISTSMKSIVGVAGGATRAALTQHLALANNLADVSAKDGSQETFVNLVASFIGIFILSTIGNEHVWPMYFILIAIHIYANYSAVKSLRLNSLNEERMALLLNHLKKTDEILNTDEVSSQESLSIFCRPSSITKKFCGFNIILGTSLTEILDKSSPDSINDIKQLAEFYETEEYMIIPCFDQKIIYVLLQTNIQSSKILKSFIHAFFFGVYITDNIKTKNNNIMTIMEPMIKYSNEKYTKWCETIINTNWDHTRNLLAVNNWRLYWCIKY